jgi:hypothetical protein
MSVDTDGGGWSRDRWTTASPFPPSSRPRLAVGGIAVLGVALVGGIGNFIRDRMNQADQPVGDSRVRTVAEKCGQRFRGARGGELYECNRIDGLGAASFVSVLFPLMGFRIRGSRESSRRPVLVAAAVEWHHPEPKGYGDR